MAVQTYRPLISEVLDKVHKAKTKDKKKVEKIEKKPKSIFSKIKGTVEFKKTKSDRTFVSVKPN